MNRIKKIFLVSILCGALFSPLFFVQAQEDPAPDVGASTPKISPAIDFPKLSVKLPGLNFNKAVCTDSECSNNWLAKYIQALYEYGIGIIGILAVITMMIGGIVWVTAAGNAERVSEAKKWIGGSLMGVLIALTSYVVLNMVNPALTELSPIKITYIEKEELPEMSQEEIAEEERLIEQGEVAQNENYASKKSTEYIIIHTAAGIMTRNQVDAYHKSKGWKGIGYNLYIERDGKLVDGRGEDAVGAHTIGYNNKSIGISYSGCGQKSPPTDQPLNKAVSSGTITQAQIDTLITIIKNLQQKYHVPRNKVLGHTETPGVGKACPCINMNEVRSKVLP